MNDPDLLSLDTPLDRRIHRPTAAKIAAVLARTPVTPNQVTVLTLVPAALAAICFSRPGWARVLEGLTFFYLWAVLDHVDGALARLTGKTSAFGRRLDDTCDIIASNVMLIGLFCGLAAADPNAGRLTAWFVGGLAADKIGGEIVLAAKRKSREEALACGDADRRFRSAQKKLDVLGGREPFYILIGFIGLCYALGGAWPVWASYVLVGGCWAMACVSLTAAAALRKRRRA